MYGQNFLYDEDANPKHMSLMFRDIWKCRKEGVTSSWISNNMFKWRIGNGLNVKFWKDVWFGNEELKVQFYRLFSLSVNQDITVADMKKNWSLNKNSMWRRRLRGWELDSEYDLGLVIENLHLKENKDVLEWRGNNNQLNSKDLYSKLDHNIHATSIWSTFWKMRMPTRIKIFMWKLMNRVLTVRAFLKTRVTGIDLDCPLCHQEEETIEHLFWTCQVTSKI